MRRAFVIFLVICFIAFSLDGRFVYFPRPRTLVDERPLMSTNSLYAHSLTSQRSNDWARARFTHFRSFWSLSRFITQNFRRQPPEPPPLEPSILSPIILPQQTCLVQVQFRCLVQVTDFFIRKSAPRESDDYNYCDKNTSLYVSLRTRKFGQKIPYCLQRQFLC